LRLADSFKLSLNSIFHRKLRAWLTLLGIVVGVAAVVAIISIGEGAQASVSDKLQGLGADVITITPGHSKGIKFGGAFRNPSHKSSVLSEKPELTKRDVLTIRGNPNVALVNEIVSGRNEFVFLSEKASFSIEGVNPTAWKEMSNLELASGRFLNSSDSSSIVIGDRIANEAFKQPITIGRRVSIGGKSFTVVGILKATGSSFGGSDSKVYMPYTSAWDVTDVNRDTFSSIQAKVKNAGVAEETAQELTEALLISRRVTEKKRDFTVVSSKAIKETVSEVTQTVTTFLGAIAAVSLIVGAIGVANSMFTSVLEKTREIGILKALGATNQEILALFVIESGLFGFFGGIIGAVLGTIASAGLPVAGLRVVPMTRSITTLVTPELLIAVLGFSTVIGILAGIMPAIQASKLKPVEALRYE